MDNISMEGIWLINAGVSSYWKTLRKREDTGIYITHSVGNSLCNRLWSCGKTDYAMNERVLHNGIHHASAVCKKTRQLCLKNQVPVPWKIQIKLHYIKLQSAKMTWTGGEASVSMCSCSNWQIFK